jgi:DNA mismatch repair protein MutL
LLKRGTINIKKLREEKAIMMSCKASIKANQFITNDEIFSLLESLRKSSNPFTCPHGRPIVIHFSSYELEKMFKRVM